MTTTQPVKKNNARPEHARGDVRDAVARYRAFHDEAGGGDVDARKSGYEDMVKGYYDLVTDFFEHGWGDSFHFAPRHRGESFNESIRRHQHFLAARLGLKPGMRVLDVGCGVGGPMRSIARFSGASVVGVNNSKHQLQKAEKYNHQAGLADRCELLEADFMHLPAPQGTFDAVYGFEATCHAPDKTGLFRELFRVLAPGGELGAYEWCLTDRYDPNDPEHHRIKKGIEEGDALPDIWTIPQTLDALRTAGFEIVESEDRALSSDAETPWHLPLTGRELSWTGVRRTWWGRRLARGVIMALEAVGKAPDGSREISEMLHRGADALVKGGDTGIFTPMFYFRARKPA
ncbi:MAG: sterol methyltransferase [Myxococcota bacterium]